MALACCIDFSCRHTYDICGQLIAIKYTLLSYLLFLIVVISKRRILEDRLMSSYYMRYMESLYYDHLNLTASNALG